MRKNRLPRYSMSLLALVAVISPLAIRAEARFALLKGTVQIYQNQKWVDANLTMKLPSGAMIQTAYRSQAVVIYPKGGQLALGPNTRITLFDNLVSSGTDREVMIEHGNVSGFVKKGVGDERNGFRLRTPTVVAGVRGSLMSGRLAGKKLSVAAIQSAAKIEINILTASVTAAESKQAGARSALARAQSTVQRLEEADAAMNAQLLKRKTALLEQYGAGKSESELRIILARDKQYQMIAGGIANNKAAIAIALDKVKDLAISEKNATINAEAARASLAAIIAEEKQLLADLAEAEQKRKEAEAKAKEAEAKAKEEALAAKQAELQRKIALAQAKARATETAPKSIPIPEGDQAQTDGSLATDPSEIIKTSTRPKLLSTVGQTGTERQISTQNDVKVGVGNDTQQIYNNINTVTQPTNTGSPTLKKL